MRGWQEDDCNSCTGRPWRSRVKVRKEWAGVGGGGREGGWKHGANRAGSYPGYIKESSPRKCDG